MQMGSKGPLDFYSLFSLKVSNFVSKCLVIANQSSKFAEKRCTCRSYVCFTVFVLTEQPELYYYDQQGTKHETFRPKAQSQDFKRQERGLFGSYQILICVNCYLNMLIIGLPIAERVIFVRSDAKSDQMKFQSLMIVHYSFEEEKRD